MQFSSYHVLPATPFLFVTINFFKVHFFTFLRKDDFFSGRQQLLQLRNIRWRNEAIRRKVYLVRIKPLLADRKKCNPISR